MSDTLTRIKQLYSGKEDWGIDGYLYDTISCGCCSTVMNVLTKEDLDGHIEDLKKRLSAAHKAQAFIEANPRELCGDCNYPKVIGAECGYCEK